MGERLDVDEVELGLVETEFAEHLMGVQPELSRAALLAFSILGNYARASRAGKILKFPLK